MRSYSLYMFCYVGILVELHAIRRVGSANCHLSYELLTVVFSTRACSPLLFTIERMPLVANSWYHETVVIYLPFFQLFQNVTVNGCDAYLTQKNKGWSILFWYYCFRACCNILYTGFCALYVVLQWEYKFFAVILELHKFIINHLTADRFTF